MAKLNMVKLNMVLKNTLFRKGYLLAGVVMAANMFVVNEMKAMETEPSSNIMPTDNNNSSTNMDNNRRQFEEGTIDTGKGKTGESKIQFVQNITNKVLSYENIINLFGGLVFSVANNYTKWWDYNPGTYCKFVWFGWRSKRFLNDIFQFELNLNLVRGVLWLFPGTYNFIKNKISWTNAKKALSYIECLRVSYLVAILFFKQRDTALIGFFLFQGFVSMPLTFHLSKFNFSISISLDSIIWAGVGKFLEKKIENELKKKYKPQKEKNDENNLNANKRGNNEGDNK